MPPGLGVWVRGCTRRTVRAGEPAHNAPHYAANRGSGQFRGQGGTLCGFAPNCPQTPFRCLGGHCPLKVGFGGSPLGAGQQASRGQRTPPRAGEPRMCTYPLVGVQLPHANWGQVGQGSPPVPTKMPLGGKLGARVGRRVGQGALWAGWFAGGFTGFACCCPAIWARGVLAGRYAAIGAGG